MEHGSLAMLHSVLIDTVCGVVFVFVREWEACFLGLWFRASRANLHRLTLVYARRLMSLCADTRKGVGLKVQVDGKTGIVEVTALDMCIASPPLHMPFAHMHYSAHR